MGLAEPRKRLKISHDPNNTAWSNSTSSYGQRLMLSQGWQPGSGLGASDRRGFNSYDSAKVKVSFKDDNLGLGASLKSKDIEHSRTGLDAFQGLLGRLNGKSDAELEAVEKKAEDRKLAMFTQGKWGSMVFVPGGLLVQRDDFKVKDEKTEEQATNKKPRNDAEMIAKAKRMQKGGQIENDTPVEEDEATAKARRKQERAEKRRRKEEKRRVKAGKASTSENPISTEASGADMSEMKKTRQRSLPTPPQDISASSTDSEKEPKAVPPSSTTPRPMVRNGRQMLRGRNIAAKKMAFADAKMLDEIFMRRT